MSIGSRTKIVIVAVAASTVFGAWYAYRGYAPSVVPDSSPASKFELSPWAQKATEESEASRAAMETWTDGRPFIITWGESDYLGDPAGWSTFDDRAMGVVMKYPRDVVIADEAVWGERAIWSISPMLGDPLFTWSGDAPDEKLQAHLIVETGCDERYSFIGSIMLADGFERYTSAMTDEVVIGGRTWKRLIRMIPHVPEGASVNRGETVWYVDRLACRTYIVDAMYPGIKGRQRLVGMLEHLELR